ncbi:MAG: 1-(5-phosphoribosyl)-5-[(5-phosphoribosylamino)methylideneamino]imidazole-4-carboxamide isomerase [Anaerolineae bacterium]|nr:1-(5-phosphoribosyl)-5-[(5-phosphoribosylamino)methylideneamino]imidazole-4-carboxamide isomerase [Anaerolineae bacterium]
MNIFPAIDIKGGRVVRLRQGDPNQQTIYDDAPLNVAQRWQAEGASWLHVVNLDGALDQATDLLGIVEKMAGLGLKIQFGGGLRSAEAVARALNSGVERAVIGTVAVEQPELVSELVALHGADRLVIALDAREGWVATHGWQSASRWRAEDLGRSLAERGARYALYTDIARDGELEGVNVGATVALALSTGLRVIASGGVRSLADVRQLQAAGNLEGVILGKALYEGLIDLRAALNLVTPSA